MRLLEFQGNFLCPYRSFEFYLSKIDPEILNINPDISVFLRAPSEYKKDDPIWFRDVEESQARLRNFFTNFTKQAKKVYNDFEWEQKKLSNLSMNTIPPRLIGYDASAYQRIGSLQPKKDPPRHIVQESDPTRFHTIINDEFTIINVP